MRRYFETQVNQIKWETYVAEEEALSFEQNKC